MKKQITCILMALALMLGLLPVTALAIPESVPVTRAQLAEALYANESLKKLIDEAGEGQQTPDFSDIGPVQDGEDPCTDQQREAILALAKAGILNGTAPGVFSPADDVTRGEAAVVLARHRLQEQSNRRNGQLHRRWPFGLVYPRDPCPDGGRPSQGHREQPL